MAAINIVTVVGAIVLLVMSLWPGTLRGCVALLALPCIALLGLAWLLTASRTLPPPWGTSARVSLGSIVVAPILVGTTLVTLVFYIPRRIVFIPCEPRFEQMLPSAPPADTRAALGRRLGIYHVDEWATDARGGVYFRTGTGPDGIGPDTMSYGFAYQPNRAGSPFGASRYMIRRLFGDWYWFRASDDWY
jgi:hypothetical protein